MKGTTMDEHNPHQAVWHAIFAVGHPDLKKYQRFNQRLPSPPRCKLCYAPYRGVGSLLMRLQGRAPSNKNPRYCSRCDIFLRKFPGGAEVETTIMFIDVCNSTALAESMGPIKFSRLMQRFYTATFPVLNQSDGFILDVRGDGLLAVYPPGFSGEDHAAKALAAARGLLGLDIAEGVQLRIGVHTGIAYLGTMTGTEAGVEDVTVLGDAANVAARLCAIAAMGQALASQAALEAAGLPILDDALRHIEIKGRTETVPVAALQ
jgi:adenylate cyclase